MSSNTPTRGSSIHQVIDIKVASGYTTFDRDLPLSLSVGFDDEYRPYVEVAIGHEDGPQSVQDGRSFQKYKIFGKTPDQIAADPRIEVSDVATVFTEPFKFDPARFDTGISLGEREFLTRTVRENVKPIENSIASSPLTIMQAESLQDFVNHTFATRVRAIFRGL